MYVEFVLKISQLLMTDLVNLIPTVHNRFETIPRGQEFDSSLVSRSSMVLQGTEGVKLRRSRESDSRRSTSEFCSVPSC